MVVDHPVHRTGDHRTSGAYHHPHGNLHLVLFSEGHLDQAQADTDLFLQYFQTAVQEVPYRVEACSVRIRLRSLEVRSRLQDAAFWVLLLRGHQKDMVVQAEAAHHVVDLVQVPWAPLAVGVVLSWTLYLHILPLQYLVPTSV